MKLRKLTLEEVEVSFEAEPEEDSPGTQASMDEECVKYIKDQIRRGNPFAWFTAKVTVKWGTYCHHEYLGGCSYKSEEDFVKNSGYYEDMVTTALEELNATLAKEFEKLLTLVVKE